MFFLHYISYSHCLGHHVLCTIVWNICALHKWISQTISEMISLDHCSERWSYWTLCTSVQHDCTSAIHCSIAQSRWCMYVLHLYFLHATATTAVARLSHCNLSVTWVDQPKTVQARITSSSPSAAWKTLVSRFVKLFHKFERCHLERGLNDRG